MRTAIPTLLAAAAFLAGGAPPAERRIPNDPLFRLQAGLSNPGGTLRLPYREYRAKTLEVEAVRGIDANLPEAWAISTGRKDVVVAFLDDGYHYDHEDLRDNVWRNPGESGRGGDGFPRETNGVDDDGNGYADDVVGWDFVFDDPDPDIYVFDGMDATRVAPYWHGTTVAGILGAKGNNGLGVAGVCWDTAMMFLKIGAQGVRGPDLNRCGRAARAIRYAAANGARIINWSGFVDDKRPEALETLHEAIRDAGRRGVLLVAGAGNSAKDIDLPENATYPACWDDENILVAAQVDFRGGLYAYKIEERTFGSNRGARNVDLAAVGQNYTTGVIHGRSVYELGDGTSCATPVVSGVAALVLSVRPDLRAPELKRVLMESVRPLPALAGTMRAPGIVDAAAALRLALKTGR